VRRHSGRVKIRNFLSVPTAWDGMSRPGSPMARGCRCWSAFGRGDRLAIGTLIGAVAGYFGGWLDTVLVRLTELFQTVPTFLLVIVIVAIGQPSAPVIALAIGVAAWPTVARLVRAHFRSLREAEFIAAARSLGYGAPRIIFTRSCPMRWRRSSSSAR